MDPVAQWRTLFNGGAGLWFTADDSRALAEGNVAILDQTDATLSPPPSLYFVKVGGDAGSLWGTDESRAALFEARHGKVIPWLFCLPDAWRFYDQLVGELFRAGAPAVVLDCEEAWYGSENGLATILDAINPAENVVGVTGYAWFLNDRDPQAWADVLTTRPVLYFPQSYLSELTGTPSGQPAAQYVSDVLAGLGFTEHGVSHILDSASLTDAGAQALAAQGVGVSVWHNENVAPEGWAAVWPSQQSTDQPSTEPSTPTNGDAPGTPSSDSTPTPDGQSTDSTASDSPPAALPNDAGPTTQTDTAPASNGDSSVATAPASSPVSPPSDASSDPSTTPPESTSTEQPTTEAPTAPADQPPAAASPNPQTVTLVLPVDVATQLVHALVAAVQAATTGA